MKILYGILIFLVAIFAALAIYLGQYGLFATVKAGEVEKPAYWLAYKVHKGDYRLSGQVMDEVYNSLLNDHQIETTKGFGLYFDNPQEVSTDQLRSVVGCIIENEQQALQLSLNSDLSVAQFPASKVVQATFPYRGEPSIALGIFKVYPVLMTEIYEKKYDMKPIMEIYDQPNEVIEYSMSLDIDTGWFEQLIAQ